MLDSRVLVLNQNYEPASICSARKAIVLLFKEKAEMVEHNHLTVKSTSIEIALPSIVRLSRFVNVNKRKVMLNRQNILRRDKYKCQYCGRNQLPLTIDHVIPKRRGGKDTWENLVCACSKCNSKKANHTPNEAGMPLLSLPKKPGRLFLIQSQAEENDARWKPYLFL